ncbi:type II toxin-antitoxin system Phd/YefM family antitoxin [Methylogaea oryzae]|uniref:Antitoxin n=1 Tax=Methylogaea oryzae TaxID=1295382 RepID=A0A8D4VT64_9GAMM|nr:type II toxin-antitoxin system prevent-host-death family antitoxin [Methylogaea oryzae]BBL71860.1 antitoxin [Methylogaea oryzae]
MTTEIGAYEAKTHLPELLRNVQAGQHFIITHRGSPVAELAPTGSSAKRKAGQAALRMQDFMRESAGAEGVDIKALLEEGRD